MFKIPIDFNALFNPLCFMRAALFIIQVTSSSLVFTFSLQTMFFMHPNTQNFDLCTPNLNSCIFTHIENWTRVYVNLFTWNRPCFHLLKYLLFLQKHLVYVYKFGAFGLCSTLSTIKMEKIFGTVCYSVKNYRHCKRKMDLTLE